MIGAMKTRRLVVGIFAALGVVMANVNTAAPQSAATTQSTPYFVRLGPPAANDSRGNTRTGAAGLARLTSSGVINLTAKEKSDYQGYKGTVYSFPLPAGTVGMTGLTGSVSTLTSGSNPSEALFIVGYLPSGRCVDSGFHFIDFTEFFAAMPGAQLEAFFIVKTLGGGSSSVSTNVNFSSPIQVSNCAFVIMDGGPSLGSIAPIKWIQFNSAMKLNYNPTVTPPPPYIVRSDDEFCFGMSWGCQLHTVDKGVAFASVKLISQTGRLISLYGNVSEGSISQPAGYWSARNAYYVDPGCSHIAPGLYGPGNYFSLVGTVVPLLDFTLSGSANVLQRTINESTNVAVTAGDCLVHLIQVNGGGTVDGPGQVDAESQVTALIQP